MLVAWSIGCCCSFAFEDDALMAVNCNWLWRVVALLRRISWRLSRSSAVCWKVAMVVVAKNEKKTHVYCKHHDSQYAYGKLLLLQGLEWPAS